MKKTILSSFLILGCMTLPVFADEVEPSEVNTDSVVEENISQVEETIDPTTEEVVPAQETEQTEVEPVQEETTEPTQGEVAETEVESETEPEVEPVVEPEPVVLNGWKENNTKYYVDNVAVNGVQKIGNDYYLFQNETLKSFTGVVKNSEGQWIHLKNGKSDFTFTGFSKSIQNNKWYFSRNGKLDWNFTGVAKSIADNKWYHAKNGALDWNFTGLSKSVQNNKWYFSRKGALDWSFTGVAKSIANNKWYHAKNGALDWTFTGISKSVADGNWYFSRKGELDWSFTGIAKSVANNKWYAVKNGRLNWNFTGLSKSVADNKYYYCKNGQLDWNYLGRAYNYDQKQYRYVLKGKQIENKTLEKAAHLMWLANKKDTGWSLREGFEWLKRELKGSGSSMFTDSYHSQNAKKGSTYHFNLAYEKLMKMSNPYIFCYNLNAVAYEMARLYKNDVKQVEGYVVNATSGNKAYHSWVEIYENGQTYLLDASLGQGGYGTDGWNITGKRIYVPNYRTYLNYRTDAVLPN